MLWWGERRQHTSTCQGPGVGAGRMFVSIKSILMIFEWKCGWLWVGWAGLAGGRSAFKYGYCQARNADQLHTATAGLLINTTLHEVKESWYSPRLPLDKTFCSTEMRSYITCTHRSIMKIFHILLNIDLTAPSRCAGLGIIVSTLHIGFIILWNWKSWNVDEYNLVWKK